VEHLKFVTNLVICDCGTP